MPMMKKMIMVTLTVIVMVVIETSKLLAIVVLKAFKHMFTSPTGGDNKVNGNEFPINK